MVMRYVSSLRMLQVKAEVEDIHFQPLFLNLVSNVKRKCEERGIAEEKTRSLVLVEERLDAHPI